MSCDYTHKYAIRLSTRRISFLFRGLRCCCCCGSAVCAHTHTHTHICNSMWVLAHTHTHNNGNNNANWWSVKDFRQLPAEDCPCLACVCVCRVPACCSSPSILSPPLETVLRKQEALLGRRSGNHNRWCRNNSRIFTGQMCLLPLREACVGEWGRGMHIPSVILILNCN